MILAKDIFYIKYENGLKETFDDSKTGARYIDRVKLQGYIYAGGSFTGYGGGPTIDISLGVRVYDYFFAGIEAGYTPFFVGGILHMLPIRVNMKGYWLFPEKFYPFLNFSLGTNLWGIDYSPIAFFDLQIGLGIEYRRLSISIGYNLQSKSFWKEHLGYAKIGIRL